jgi:hypothetical protein
MTQGIKLAHVADRVIRDLERGDIASLLETLRCSGKFFEPAVEHAREAFEGQIFGIGREEFEEIVASLR